MQNNNSGLNKKFKPQKHTVESVKKNLVEVYGWDNMNFDKSKWFVDELIKDTIKILSE